jgi:hypothetical protein
VAGADGNVSLIAEKCNVVNRSPATASVRARGGGVEAVMRQRRCGIATGISFDAVSYEYTSVKAVSAAS